MHRNAWDAFSMTCRLIESYFNAMGYVSDHGYERLSRVSVCFNLRDITYMSVLIDINHPNQDSDERVLDVIVNSRTARRKNEAAWNIITLCPREILRYITTSVWLPCLTLYEFTHAVRFVIGREARFAPLYLSLPGLVLR